MKRRKRWKMFQDVVSGCWSPIPAPAEPWVHQCHHLYRHFDREGKLLYVGISVNALGRLSEHRNSRWFDEIAEVKIEHFGNRNEVLQAERLAVANEKPAHNKQLRKLRSQKVLQPSEPKTAERRLLTMKQLLEIVPVGRSTLKRMIKNEEFPSARYISSHKRVWYDDEIQEWQEALLASQRKRTEQGQSGPERAK